MPEASPTWQTAFLVWAFVCIGWMIFAGWRAGIIRGGISLAALFCAYLAGSAAAWTIPASLLEWLPLPGLIAQLAAGALVGFAVFLAIWFFGAALFKRTSHQGSFIVRLFWGLGGAFFGLLFGIVIVLTVLAGVRTVGAFSETRMDAEVGGSTNARIAFWEPYLVKLKRSIEAGDTGSMIEAVDVTPDQTIRIVSKLGRIFSDPQAAQRLLDSPHVVPVVSDRAFVNLIADPEINEAVINGQYVAILTNPKVLEAVRDPELWRKMQSVRWEAAMDEALLLQASPEPVPEN